jgi:GNAT superfamily N-acetyltransferase
VVDFIERRSSEFNELAFCKSSVQLWCEARQKVVELAITADSAGGHIRALGIASRVPSLRLWLPYVASSPSSDLGELQALLSVIYGKLELDAGATEAVAFAEVGTLEAQLLAQLGWGIERHFPVQIVWNKLQSWTSPTSSLGNGIEISSEENLDVVARLFREAFLSEWRWYFRELGWDDTSSAEGELLRVARRYVANASAYLIARRDGEPVGLSSVTLDPVRRHAEFHTGVGVSPDARGLGLGRALTNATLAWAKRNGMNTAEIRTQERLGERNRNVEMYEACGGERLRVFALLRLIPQARG